MKVWAGAIRAKFSQLRKSGAIILFQWFYVNNEFSLILYNESWYLWVELNQDQFYLSEQEIAGIAI